MHLAGFTKKDRQLIETVLELVESGIRENIDEKAALQLGWAPTTVRTRWCRLRVKYASNEDFMKEYRSTQQRLYHKTGGQYNPLGRR